MVWSPCWVLTSARGATNTRRELLRDADDDVSGNPFFPTILSTDRATDLHGREGKEGGRGAMPLGVGALFVAQVWDLNSKISTYTFATGLDPRLLVTIFAMLLQ